MFFKIFLFYWACASTYLAISAIKYWDEILNDHPGIPIEVLKILMFLLVTVFGWLVFPRYIWIEAKFYYRMIIIIIKWRLGWLKRRIRARLYLWGFIKIDPDQKVLDDIGKAIIGITVDILKLHHEKGKDTDSVPDNGKGKKV